MIAIILGLIGLSLVVVIHELGHFAAARALGVEVEAFSIGWGPRIAGFRRKGTEWRISAFPIGGYCRMKGEESFRKALEEKAPEMPRETGSFYGAAPWRRIVISLSGPVANVIFALLIFTVVSFISYDFPTDPNRIVLLSEFPAISKTSGGFPADAAGLQSGDRIIAIDGKPVSDYYDISETIMRSARRQVALTIERGGTVMLKVATPMLNTDAGSGLLGILAWADPVVGEVAPGSAAQIAGIASGDRIVSIDGKEVLHRAQAESMLDEKKPERVSIAVDRSGRRIVANLILSWNAQGGSNLGISFKRITHYVKAATSLGAAARAGVEETLSTFDDTVKGLGSLFQGVNLLKALSGPARITYMVGQSAQTGIQRSASGGLALPLQFLAFLSIGLFIMNLLPIPALDGGQIVMFSIEGIRRRGLRPITIYRYQFVGAALILAIFVLATVGDYLFFAAK